MFLFIDTLSEPTYICLFDKVRNIIDSHTWPGKQKEFDTLSEKIDELLSKNTIKYSELSGIVVMVWPGGFTGTRVTTLVANSLAYGFEIPLFPLTVGEFFAYQETPLPWIIPITKKEVLLWEEADSPTISEICTLAEWIYSGLSPIDFASPNHTMNRVKWYTQVIASLPLTHSQKQVKPLYAKDPNITLKKSNGS